jgi:exodeoxyribonuclease VII small subunit
MVTVPEGADLSTRVTFEEELDSLEKAVGRLESGNLTLDEAMREFEVGFRCWRRCVEILQEAQQRIEVLCRAAGDSLAVVGKPEWKPESLRSLQELRVAGSAEGRPVDEDLESDRRRERQVDA